MINVAIENSYHRPLAPEAKRGSDRNRIPSKLAFFTDFRNNFRVPGPVFLGGKPFNMTLWGGVRKRLNQRAVGRSAHRVSSQAQQFNSRNGDNPLALGGRALPQHPQFGSQREQSRRRRQLAPSRSGCSGWEPLGRWPRALENARRDPTHASETPCTWFL